MARSVFRKHKRAQFSNCALARLTALGRDEIAEALNRLSVEIADYLDVLSSRARLMGIIRDELGEDGEQVRRSAPDRACSTATPTWRTRILSSVRTWSYWSAIAATSSAPAPRPTVRKGTSGKGRGAMATRDEDFVAGAVRRLDPSPVLFFSSTGENYKVKVWRLPLAAPQARGKALVNLLPLEQDERITTIMALPEDEESWEALDVMFATTRGTVRRNKLSDFAQVNRAGKIAMRIDEGERIVDVQICSDKDDVLLTTARGQCIRFPVDDVRVFKGRNLMGVRGVALAEGDSIISLAILRSIDATADERVAYLKQRRATEGEADEAQGAAESEDENGAESNGASTLEPDRFEAMRAAEQVILTISENGYGKRTSSFEYRVTGRGGKGIVAMAVNARNGALVASFPVEESDELMLVTDGGQLIRVPVTGIRIAGRSTQGVIVFDTAEEEHVVSVDRIGETGGEAAGDEEAE